MVMRFCLCCMLLAGCAATAQKPSILVVFSHPDDETTIGPLLAKYAKAGHDVHLVSITSGQKGTTPNTNLPAGDQLGAAREEELRCSTRQLGIQPPLLLQFQDQGISIPPVMEQIAARLRAIIEQTRPAVIITWGPEGVTGHPDHRTTSSLVSQVFQQRSLLTHKPKKLYYVAFPESKFSSPSERRPFRTTSDLFITTAIEAGDAAEAAAHSIECHKTQWDAERMKQMKALFRDTMGGRVFLRLALAETPASAPLVERDLFQGVSSQAASAPPR